MRPIPELGVAAVVLAGCGALLGPPVRAKTHGYRAHVTLVEDGVAKEAFELAVRGDLMRRDPAEGAAGPTLILDEKAKTAFRLDPARRTCAEAPFEEARRSFLPGYPLLPGWSDAAEAQRLGITRYRREGDEVFAGNVCALWRFEDRPDAAISPATTFWQAPALDGLVIRVDREEPRADGRWSRRSVEMTNVRVLAEPDLFLVPKGWRRVPP